MTTTNSEIGITSPASILNITWGSNDYAYVANGKSAEKLHSSAVAPIVAAARGYEQIEDSGRSVAKQKFQLSDWRTKSWSSDGREPYEIPSQVAITKVRARLGPEPLAELFTRVCVPLATRQTPGAFYRAWRLVSIDGTCIDVADTPANAGVFGRAGTGRGDGSAFPQLRMVALGECGTHAIIAAAIDSYDVGEVSLAKKMITALTSDMLRLADRGFTAHPLFSAAAATGAALLWRAKSNANFPVLERFDDGSYRSGMVATGDKRTRTDVTPVRIIEYSLKDPGRPESKATRRSITLARATQRAIAELLHTTLPPRRQRANARVCHRAQDEQMARQTCRPPKLAPTPRRNHPRPTPNSSYRYWP